ncbi:transcriptional regulator [filamentous cyanobacterium CCP5]|nr:transcriptional regulator [filamentous cyanobacterium CCP5]
MVQVPQNLSLDVASLFKALSEPIRVEVIELLRDQEMCVCDLCDRLGVAQSKLSFHLKTLKHAGLVRSRQQGRWIYYRLNLARLVELEEYLAEFRRHSPRLPARICTPDDFNQ